MKMDDLTLSVGARLDEQCLQAAMKALAEVRHHILTYGMPDLSTKGWLSMATPFAPLAPLPPLKLPPLPPLPPINFGGWGVINPWPQPPLQQLTITTTSGANSTVARSAPESPPPYCPQCYEPLHVALEDDGSGTRLDCHRCGVYHRVISAAEFVALPERDRVLLGVLREKTETRQAWRTRSRGW